MLIRKKYLRWINQVKDTEFIKIITGVRRSGKSMILQMVYENLIQNDIPATQILLLNFESLNLQSVKTDQALRMYIKSQTFDSSKKVYFLFDEIQEVEGWQRVINGLRVDYNADIYITGSNAKLLSGELATYLSGRYIQLKVFPLSFEEYLQFIGFDRKTANPETVFYDYVTWGGFPMLPFIEDETIKRSVTEGIFDSIILKDIALRGEIRDKGLLIRIINFLLDNIGQTVSAKKISDTLRSNSVRTTPTSVDRYLELLCDALVFYRVKRYDIRGKEYLKTAGKYYVVDTGLRNVQLGRTSRDNIGSQLENIVYLELVRRGYTVFIGKYDKQEIDFIADKDGEPEYYQVAYQLPTDSTREEGNLLLLPDNYKKTIITANRMDVGNIEGIDVVHIVDWLLEAGSE